MTASNGGGVPGAVPDGTSAGAEAPVRPRVRHRSRPQVPPSAGAPPAPAADQPDDEPWAPAHGAPRAGPDNEPNRRPPRQRTGDYEVGYARPPKEHRFEPGRSGNPKGRPKGARCLKSQIERELDAKVTVREGGREKAMTKRELVAKQTVKKAAEGDPRALMTLLKITGLGNLAPAARVEGAATAPAADGLDHGAIIEEFRQRLMRGALPASGEATQALAAGGASLAAGADAAAEVDRE
jgi:hypothetical protein